MYGNCQAEATVAILTADPVVSKAFRILFSRSFDDPVAGRGELSKDDVSACAVIFEQHDASGFPYREWLPADCVTVRFPAVDLNLLWPFNRTNPYNTAPTPELPWGHFPYGDRVIVDCVEKGMTAKEILAYYHGSPEAYMPDLNRFFQIERGRLASRDSRCDVKMGDFVFSNFRKQRFFWCVNHPAPAMLGELVARLLGAASEAYPMLGEADTWATLKQQFSAEGPLGVLSVPIHPGVASFLGLEWYDASTSTYQSYGGITYTYESYFEEMVKRSIAMKERAATSAP